MGDVLMATSIFFFFFLIKYTVFTQDTQTCWPLPVITTHNSIQINTRVNYQQGTVMCFDLHMDIIRI